LQQQYFACAYPQAYLEAFLEDGLVGDGFFYFDNSSQ
jgi:hypothetical protein